MTIYPEISSGTLPQFQMALMAMDANPDYLTNPACPFSEDVKTFLRSIKFGAVVGERNIFVPEENKLETIERQIGSLIQSLDELAKSLTTKDNAEKLQYFKTKATLIERLVGMQKDIFSVKEMAEFQSIYMQFMEDICTKDQVAELLKRLDHLNSVKERK